MVFPKVVGPVLDGSWQLGEKNQGDELTCLQKVQGAREGTRHRRSGGVGATTLGESADRGAKVPMAAAT